MEKITLNLKNKINANIKDAKYIEISTQNGKSLEYNITNDYYTLWTSEKIKNAFAFGSGSEKDFLQYAKDNKNFAMFYKI